MHVGDIIRDRHGSWILWRVVETFGADSPFVLARTIVRSKTYHQPGEQELLRKEHYHVERDPLGFVRRHIGTFVLVHMPEKYSIQLC